MAKKKTRNPHAGVLSRPEYRKKVEKSAKEKSEVRDGWNRKGKHRKTFQIGDTVEYLDKNAIVKKPNGPENMVGITQDGVYHLAHQEEISMLEESVNRMFQLCESDFVTITSGLRVMISSEERDIWDKAPVLKSALDERGQEVARKMVSRGLLNRIKQDGKMTFTKNQDNLRRF